MPHQYTRKELYSLIIPLIADSFLSILIGMADTVMVSTCGEAAVSGVSLVDTVSNLLITLFSAFATGGAVVVSQYLGRSDKESARRGAKNLIYISAAISIAMTLIVMPIRSHIVDFFFGTIDADVKGFTDDYFVPILLSYPFLALYSALTAISRAENRSFRTMGVSAMMNAINITGNAILIYGFGMGPRGAGISSLLSRVAGFAIMFIFLHRRSDMLSLSGIAKGPVDLKMIARILRIGIPAGLEGATFHIGKIMVQSLTASLGTSAIAINAVTGNFNAYSNIPGNGINLALITIIGQCRGKDNFKDINYYTKLMMLIVYISTLIITIPLYILSPLVIHLYGLESTTAITALPIARGCLMACLLIWPFAFTLPNTLKANGDVKFIMLTSFFSMWIFRVALSYLLIRHFGFGVEGVWYSMYADWAFRGVLYFLRYKGGKWKEKAVI